MRRESDHMQEKEQINQNGRRDSQMQLSCEIVQDLLPLYEENLCSAESRAAVEVHLRECPKCREMLQKVENIALKEERTIQADTEAQAVAGSFRKVRRRWRASLIAMLLVIPMLILSINQYRGSGICFTNVDDIWVARKYFQALEQKEYEKLASYIHYEYKHQQIKELVIAEPDVNGSDYSTQMLEEDRAWIVSDSFYREHLRWEENMLNFWRSIIFNQIPGIMIPEDIWTKVISEEHTLCEETEDGILWAGGKAYIPIETKWGDFVVEHESDLLHCDSAAEFCNRLSAVPTELYEEAYPELEKQAWESYTYKQAHFAEAAAMSLEEFTGIVKKRNIAELEQCEELGISIKNTGYKNSYYVKESDVWQVEFGTQVLYEGKSFPIGITVTIQDGKVRNTGSMSYANEFREMEEIVDALHKAVGFRYSDY